MARRPQVMRSQTIAVVEASTRRGDGGKPNQAGATFDYPCASPELHITQRTVCGTAALH